MTQRQKIAAALGMCLSPRQRIAAGIKAMHTEEVIGTGNTTYASTKTAQYDLSFIPQQVAFGDKAAYLYRLCIQAKVVISNTSGGTVTIGKAKLYDFLQQCTLVTPEFQFVNLLNSAGQSLWMDGYLRKLKLPEVFTDTAITNGNSGTFNVTLYIDCYDLRGQMSPEDELIWCEILRDSKLLLVWGSCDTGGVFGTNVNLTAASTLTVTAEIVARDEVRLPVLWHMEEFQATAMKGNIPINGVIYTDIAIQQVQGQGQASTGFSTADITTTTLFNLDGVDVIKNAATGLIVAQWNEQVFGSGDRLPQFEAGANNFLIPLLHMKKSSGKRAKMPLVRGNPTYNLAGTLASPASNLRFYLRWLAPQGTSYAQKVLQRTGVWRKLGPNPFARLRAKTASKVPTTVAAKAMSMPIKVSGRPSDLISPAGV